MNTIEIDGVSYEVSSIGGNVVTGSKKLSTTDHVAKAQSDLGSFLDGALKPIVEKIKNISGEYKVDSASVSLAIKVGAKGSFIVAAGTAEANINVTINFRNE